jgi:hypothetical protein
LKRAFILPLVGAALALSVFAAGAAAFGTGDTKGPACRDITGGNFIYDAASSFSGSISTDGPACKNVTYTVVVQSQVGSAATTTSIVGNVGTAPDPSTVVFDPTTIADDDGTICVYVTSGTGGHLVDRGPDTGCIDIVRDTGSGGGQSFS